MLANGCATPKKYAHKDPFFSIDMFVALAKAMHNGSMLATVEGLFTTHGKTFQSNSWVTTVINTMDPLVIQKVLANSSEKFGVAPSRIPVVEPLMHDGIFTADGQSWAYHRSVAKQIFFGVGFSVIPSLEKHANRLLELIPRDGSTVDIQPLLKRIFLFGVSQDSLLAGTKDGSTEGFISIFDKSLIGLHTRMFLSRLIFIRGRDTQLRKDISYVHASIDRYVEMAIDRQRSSEKTVKEVSSGNYVYLDELVKKTKDKTKLRNQMLNLFLPARLRLLAPAGLSIRTCGKDCVFPRGGGPDGQSPILVRPGTEIRIVFHALHKDRDIWGENAMDFRPERWENLRATWEYIPFLGGGRVFPAQQMALSEVSYLVVRFMQEFKTMENRDLEKKFAAGIKLSMESKNGVKVGLR
ncbi:putative cytochrome p450 alkane hydroxylase protein [Botrytis fragariae]|uniref:Putative cytochrome p450 alkane hydroxylase protein n=1 Tax=Botrytis fragariae TaxID=1964551 RepID=A0A8H6AIT2_9HELO|nr:putative cytochrome p450 alkane hydroxylase protein [Botrytis fragariae]KAF5868071.1 putative cytochrome p450 alkane hydroxylase protein [Botrytis fragariae]